MNSKLCVAIRSVKFWARRTVRVWRPFKISSNSPVFKNLYRLNGVWYNLWLCHQTQITTTHSETLHATGDFTIRSSQWVFLVYQWITLTLWMLKLFTDNYVNRLKWRRHISFCNWFFSSGVKEHCKCSRKKSHSQFQTKKKAHV